MPDEKGKARAHLVRDYLVASFRLFAKKIKIGVMGSIDAHAAQKVSAKI